MVYKVTTLYPPVLRNIYSIPTQQEIANSFLDVEIVIQSKYALQLKVKDSGNPEPKGNDAWKDLDIL
jgi:hypothetical protein